MVLQRLSPEGTQRHLAHVFGVSESTITRWKDDIEPVMKIAAHLGLKLVDAGRICVPAGEIEMLRATYARVSEQAPWLLNEAES